jgi:hypothetical protein
MYITVDTLLKLMEKRKIYTLSKDKNTISRIQNRNTIFENESVLWQSFISSRNMQM